MKIRSLAAFGAAVLVAAPVFTQSAYAQDPANKAYNGNVFVYQGGSGRREFPGRGATFIATEMSFDGAVVKGAPYSAEAVTETVQMLADGNRIVNTTQSKIYRDTEGRTRREQSIAGIGPWTTEQPQQIVMINDPVAGVHYVFNPDDKSARKLPATNVFVRAKGAGRSEGGVAGSAGGPVGVGVNGDAVKSTAKVVVVEGEPAMAPPEQDRVFTVATASGGPAMRVELTASDDKDAKKESLGKREIEGVQADGTRTTVTIAAGSIGNERPIEVVSEQWYSAELQAIVLSRHTDPRFGETTYRLASIDRSEPSKALFEVPADYKVEDMSGPTQLRIKRDAEKREIEKKSSGNN